MGADRTFTNFKTQNVLIGKTAQPFPTDVSLANAPAAAAAPPTPIYKRQPVSPSNPAPAELAKAEPPPPPPRPTPVPLKTTPASADEIPLEVPKPATPPPKPPPPDPEPEPEPQQQRPKFAESKMAMITTPRPQPKQPQEKPGASGFQPHLEQTKIEGAISNRGRPAVDSVRTPLAVYKKHISEAIGSRWYYYIKAQMDLITVGTVTISFAITADGRVQDVRVVSNTGNASLANVCEQSVREAEIAPPPPDVVENMRDGRMELPFTFTFYDTH
jgi:TonB family protein